MEWTTHALSGFVLGYAVTGDWKLSLVSGIMAVIPDLDEPKSKFGKLFFFISIPVNAMFEHRTFTHSLLFVWLVGFITALFSKPLSFACMAGLLAHILGDMLTGKVLLFYPLNKKVGLAVSRLRYIIIDRMTRVVVLILACLIGYHEIQTYL